MSDDYISRLDEIDKWLFDSFGILPGACSSQENLRHTTARMVAEALWPKKESFLTWEDVEELDKIMGDVWHEAKHGDLNQGFYAEVLKCFNEKKKEK